MMKFRGSDWDEAAVDAFESLTYCSQWKTLMARIESHLHINERLIPCVKLVDTNGEKVSIQKNESIYFSH